MVRAMVRAMVRVRARVRVRVRACGPDLAISEANSFVWTSRASL